MAEGLLQERKRKGDFSPHFPTARIPSGVKIYDYVNHTAYHKHLCGKAVKRCRTHRERGKGPLCGIHQVPCASLDGATQSVWTVFFHTLQYAFCYLICISVTSQTPTHKKCHVFHFPYLCVILIPSPGSVRLEENLILDV